MADPSVERSSAVQAMKVGALAETSLLPLLMAAPEFQVTLEAASSQTIWQLLLEALLTLCSQKKMGYLAHFTRIYQRGIFRLQLVKEDLQERSVPWDLKDCQSSRRQWEPLRKKMVPLLVLEDGHA